MGDLLKDIFTGFAEAHKIGQQISKEAEDLLKNEKSDEKI